MPCRPPKPGGGVRSLLGRGAEIWKELGGFAERLYRWRATPREGYPVGLQRWQAAEMLRVPLRTIECWEQGISIPTNRSMLALLEFTAPELIPTEEERRHFEKHNRRRPRKPRQNKQKRESRSAETT